MRSHFSNERPCWVFGLLFRGMLPTLILPFSQGAVLSVLFITEDSEVDKEVAAGRFPCLEDSEADKEGAAGRFPCLVSEVSLEPPRKGTVSKMPFESVCA